MRTVRDFVWPSQPRAIRVGGLTRRYRLYRPPGLPSALPVPLVLALHGGLGSGAQAEYAYGFDAIADRQRFQVAYPDGVGKSWNAGACCGPARREGVDDVGFLAAIVSEIAAAGELDAARVYAAGISNGGMLAYRLACDRPGLLAAIGAVAGTMMCDCPSPAPTSVLHIHGLLDEFTPFGGGVGPKSLFPEDRPPVPSVVELWRQAGRCGPPQVTDQGPVRWEVALGPGGVEVTLCTIADAGHQWPGSRPAAPAVAAMLRLDPPSQAFNATEVLWDFFARHPRGPR